MNHNLDHQCILSSRQLQLILASFNFKPERASLNLDERNIEFVAAENHAWIHPRLAGSQQS